MREYPTRQPFFANRFVRLLTKSAAAQQLGSEVCWLLTVVAFTEDVRRYASPATFYNEQLLPLVGFGGRDRLERARSKAVTAGWLVYEAGRKGCPGSYFVTVPNGFDALPDGSSDEADSILFQDGNPAAMELSHSLFDSVSPPGSDGKRVDNPAPSIPIPIPIPKPRKSARHDEVDERLPDLVKAWNELGRSIAPAVTLDPLPKAVREGWKKVHADPEARNVFDDTPALMQAIRAATFCHGKGYFTLAWIFTRDRQTKELRAAKILAGAYSDPKAKLSQDRFFFNPERPVDEKF